MSREVEEVMEGKQDGRTITHAPDSTTKKTVGQLLVQGLHVGQSCPLPMTILPIYGEKAEDVAMQVCMDNGHGDHGGVQGHDICEVVQRGGHIYGR